MMFHIEISENWMENERITPHSLRILPTDHAFLPHPQHAMLPFVPTGCQAFCPHP